MRGRIRQVTVVTVSPPVLDVALLAIPQGEWSSIYPFRHGFGPLSVGLVDSLKGQVREWQKVGRPLCHAARGLPSSPQIASRSTLEVSVPRRRWTLGGPNGAGAGDCRIGHARTTARSMTAPRSSGRPEVPVVDHPPAPSHVDNETGAGVAGLRHGHRATSLTDPYPPPPMARAVEETQGRRRVSPRSSRLRRADRQQRHLVSSPGGRPVPFGGRGVEDEDR